MSLRVGFIEAVCVAWVRAVFSAFSWVKMLVGSGRDGLSQRNRIAQTVLLP
jgi:hypothetical protein